jgi:transcriptional regulator with XRE-family HTH domain
MNEPVAKLKELVESSSQALMAEQLGVTQQYISAVLTGVRPPGKKLLKWLGFERQVTYRKSNGRGAKKNGA